MGFILDEQDLRKYMAATLGLSQGTIVTRLSRIKIFYSWLRTNNCPITTLSVEDFFWFKKESEGLQGSSLNVYIHSLRTFESYLVARGISEKFMDGKRKYRMEDPNKIPLSAEEIKILKDACREKTPKKLIQVKRDMIILLIDSGMRWEDAQSLTCKSVDVIGRQLIYIQMKTGRQRIVHLEEPLLSILQERILYKEPAELVFTNSLGRKQHYAEFYQFLVDLAKSLGIVKHVSPHILRHSYCQNLYEQIGDINLVKDTIGHRNINSTLRYVRNSPKRVRTAQQMHPHLTPDVKPQIKIDVLEKEIHSQAFEEDERFDYLKVKEAIGRFVLELHHAIKEEKSLNLP
jgi:integrase/recombinase XerD